MLRSFRRLGVAMEVVVGIVFVSRGTLSAQTVRELTKTYAERAPARKPALLFLPGFGGSLLRVHASSQECRLEWPGDFDSLLAKQKGKVVWGTGSIDSDELRLDIPMARNLQVCPEPLLDFRVRFLGFFHQTQHPYRTFWEALLPATKDLAEPEFFAYDWRKDAHVSAERLGERLQQLRGREVVLMTHSWGSAVVWDFLTHVYDPARHATLRHIVFIAPSFCGLCEILRAVQSGLPAIPEQDSEFTSKLARSLFGSRLRRAFFTFPGAFEHLPATGECPGGSCGDDVLNYACLELPQGLPGEPPGSGRRPADFFSRSFWESQVAKRTFFFGETPWASPQQKPQFFAELESVLATAKAFRAGLSGPDAKQALRKWRIPATIVYSAEYATVRKAKIPESDAYASGEGEIPLNFVFQVPGDGRVPLDTVRDADYFPSEPGDPIAVAEKRLTQPHGDLPNVAPFLAWLKGKGEDGDPGLPAILSSAQVAASLETSADPQGVDPKVRLFVKSHSATSAPATAAPATGQSQLDLGRQLLQSDELKPAVLALSEAKDAASSSQDVVRQARVGLVKALAREGKCRQANEIHRAIGGEAPQELAACSEGRRQKAKP